MLSKLLKYEFRQTGKTMGPVYLSIFVVSLISMILGSFSGMENGQLNQVTNVVQMAFAFFLTVTILAVVGLIIGTMIFNVVRFNKNLMDTEGYFMFSLPVSAGQHIASKLIVATVWSIVSILFSVIVIPGLVIGSTRTPLSEVVGFIKYSMSILPSNAILLALSMFLAMTLGMMAVYALSYMALSVGPHITKNRVAGTLIAFFGADILMQIVTTVGTYVVGNTFFAQINIDSVQALNMWMSNSQNFVKAMSLGLCATGLYTAVWSALFLVICNHFLSKKLNLA